jgi:hypothetical protein
MMKFVFGVAAAFFLGSTLPPVAHADPPHYGGLPPGLQKKVERGGALAPGWRREPDAYAYGYDDPYYGQYEPEYLEDKVVRIIKDVRDLTNSLAR